MWTYIARRLLLMIPTLFGVTVVSFCIMQLAPGDPVQAKLASSGSAGQSSQNREAYLIQKRDLKLDKPLLLNFNYFRDYGPRLVIAARYRAMSTDEVVARLNRIAEQPQHPEHAPDLALFRELRIKNLDRRLRPPDLSAEQLAASGLTPETWEHERQASRRSLAEAIQGLLLPWCENVGIHGVPPAIKMLQEEKLPPEVKVGVLRCLNSMVVSPFEYTYPRGADARHQKHVQATWKLLWEQEQRNFQPVDPDRKAALAKRLTELAALPRAEMFEAIQGAEFSRDDVPFFVERILDESPLAEKVVAAEFSKLYVSTRLQAEASLGGSAEELRRVIGNWVTLYQSSRDQFEFSTPSRLAYVLIDTQYSHMVWRLITFQFGRSTLRTREPVSDRIWRAAWVSVPLLFLAELVVYVVAVPIGVLTAAYRGKWVDRTTVLILFILYSVPAFVAGMLFLLFFCYGDYLRWFPTERLHSPGAENFTYIRYVADYFWHATLPVACLSLFSFAGLAMYGRSAMLDVLGQDYIRTARAKGLPASTVVLKHGLRNGLIPFITLFANFLPFLLGGSVLIEYLFNIPGMGRLSFDCIQQKDFPTLMALIYIDAIVVMFSMLLTDLLYVLVDPRITFAGKS